MLSGKQATGSVAFKMAEFWTLTGAFGYFGATAKNIRYAWSARSESTVVLTWWKDEVKTRDGKLIYDMRSHPRFDQWRGRRGNRDRIKNLIHARDRCDGLFRIVWVRTSDQDERVRKTAKNI
jgi:hypothetical protein